MDSNHLSKNSIDWRSLVTRLGMMDVSALPAGTLWMSSMHVRADDGHNARLNGSGVVILRFLATAEILENDLWQQYHEIALRNESDQLALNITFSVEKRSEK